jgi:hypothetical protein
VAFFVFFGGNVFFIQKLMFLSFGSLLEAFARLQGFFDGGMGILGPFSVNIKKKQ